MASTADSGNYTARATAIRETAKWIAAIFAGAGAVLFSGLSFANVAQAASTDDWLPAVILAAVPVLAAALAVREAAAVITTEPPETRVLIGALGEGQGTDEVARTEVERLRPAVVATYGSVGAFDERLREAQEKYETARTLYADDRLPERLSDLNDARDALDALQDGVRDVVMAADYARVKRRYATARWRLLGLAVVATLAAAASGVLAGRAQRDEASSRFTEPTNVRVFLNAGLQRSKLSSPCPFSDQETAVAIGGTSVMPILLVDGAESQGAPASCSRTWMWAPRAREVVVVPVGRNE
jgi:hypothetical protein